MFQYPTNPFTAGPNLPSTASSRGAPHCPTRSVPDNGIRADVLCGLVRASTISAPRSNGRTTATPTGVDSSLFPLRRISNDRPDLGSDFDGEPRHLQTPDPGRRDLSDVVQLPLLSPPAASPSPTRSVGQIRAAVDQLAVEMKQLMEMERQAWIRLEKRETAWTRDREELKNLMWGVHRRPSPEYIGHESSLSLPAGGSSKTPPTSCSMKCLREEPLLSNPPFPTHLGHVLSRNLVPSTTTVTSPPSSSPPYKSPPTISVTPITDVNDITTNTSSPAITPYSIAVTSGNAAGILAQEDAQEGVEEAEHGIAIKPTGMSPYYDISDESLRLDMGKKQEIVEDVPCGKTVAMVHLDRFLIKNATRTNEEFVVPLLKKKERNGQDEDFGIPTGDDRVNEADVHYKGTLIDGTKFDSSCDRGRLFKFKLGPDQVIMERNQAADNAFQDILTTLQKPDGGEYGKYCSLPGLNDPRIEKLPYSIRILLESAIRNCDNFQVTKNDVEEIVDWENTSPRQIEISFKPARVLLQDFTGMPAGVDLACMRDAMNKLGSNSNKINPLVPVDLVIDRSVQVDLARSENAVQSNMELEFQRNNERIGFLKWGSTAFHNMLVVPPGSGIVHQVNLEYLGRVVFNIGGIQYSDSVVGTDSHTTMIDGRGVAGWGVGGFEAETAMFGQPMSMVLPGVVGFKLTGKLRNGVTTTDFVLTVTQMLRKHGVLGKFVEFYGEDMSELSLADRATIANMPPEYGTTMGFFPVDHITLQYLKLTGRSAETVSMIEASLRAYKMFVHCSNSTHPVITAENLPGFMSVLLECISDAPNAVEKGCGAICFLAQGYEEAVQDSSLLTPYLTNIITALLLAADRTDTTTSRLRVSAYETLNEIVRCSKIPETANTSGQLLLEVMSRLNKTVDIHILSPEDREKQSDLQALQCGVLQVIIQKLSGYEETGVLQVIIQKLSGYEETKPIILQAADRMMVSLLQVFACRSSTVHEEVMLAIGALVYATGVEFAKYLLVFYKYLDMGRQNHEEYQVCFVSAGVVGDICRSLDEKVLPSCDGIMTNLLKNLSNPSLPRSVKPPIFSCFEDIALAIGKNFEDYLTYAMPILQGAAELVLHWMLLMKILLIMVINSDVESLRLLWHTPGTQEFKGPAIGALCKPSSAVTEAVCIDKDRDEAVTKATVAVMGGLAAALGPNIKILFKDPHFPYRFGGAMGGLGSIRV